MYSLSTTVFSRSHDHILSREHQPHHTSKAQGQNNTQPHQTLSNSIRWERIPKDLSTM